MYENGQQMIQDGLVLLGLMTGFAAIMSAGIDALKAWWGKEV